MLGSTTVKVNEAATAASNAFPPLEKINLPVSEARGCGDEITLFEYLELSEQPIAKIANIRPNVFKELSIKKKVCKIYKPFFKVLLINLSFCKNTWIISWSI